MSGPELDEVNSHTGMGIDDNHNEHDNENIDSNDFNSHDNNSSSNQQENQNKPPPRKRRRLVISCTECHRRKQKVRSPTRYLHPFFLSSSTIRFNSDSHHETTAKEYTTADTSFSFFAL